MSSESILLPGTLWRESEFQGGLTGACGPNALSMCASWSHQKYIPTLDVYRAMRAERPPLCDANGVSNIGDLRGAATLIGLPLADTRWYAEPWGDWRAFFTTHLSAGRIILLEVANGQALVDSISGKGENARNLRYHFIACAGRLGNGDWLCLDGDNFATGNVHQVYPDSVLAAAQPCAALAIGALAKMSYSKLPSGWYECDQTHESIGAGLYADVVKHGWQNEPLRVGETRFGEYSYYATENHLGFWSHADNTAHADTHNGEVLKLFRDAWRTEQAQVASLTKQLDAANAHAQDVQRQLDAAKANPPATTSETTPAAPSKADELVAAIKAALAA